MTFDMLLFDLDGTLYDQDNGYENNIHSNIFEFMVQATGGKFDKISTIEEARYCWQPIFNKYNLTKRGLLGEGYIFDTIEYDKFIRKGASKFIQQDPELRAFLQSLPQKRKVIFTNAPEESAHEILDLLGVADLFESVLGTEFLQNKVCKPEKEAFVRVLNHLGVPESEYKRVCYFEDSFKNLVAGKKLGFTTVFVSSSTLANEGRSADDLSQFDAVVERKVGMGLKEILPSLWI
jgi:pyrimidine 5'-nucleotidase